MRFKDILIVIFIISFCFCLMQCLEFIQNYDSIKEFNTKYSKYEYMATPSYSYIDKSVYDPNDSSLTSEEKWRCVLTDEGYAGMNNKGIVVIDGSFKIWNEITDCYEYIFTNPFLTYNNPCSVDQTNTYCGFWNNAGFK